MKEYRHNKTGLEFVRIPAGSFMMGSNNGSNDEKPVHRVTLKPFLMSKTEVTQGAWKKVMGTTPLRGKSYVKEGANYPATYVSWTDAKSFCQKTGLRLPSEAQWEYACRGGTSSKYYWGENMDGAYAWYDGNAYNIGEKYAHEVGQKKPNAYGLYDMSGNVWEWCEDWYHNSYKNASSDGSANDISASNRVNRGGCWDYFGSGCRSANRSYYSPGGRFYYLGFRLVLDLSP